MSEIIGNRFECIEEIGKGTDSIVFRGVDRQTDLPVAIKIITASPSSGFTDLRNEINARRVCQSTDIVPIIAYGTFDTDSGPRHYIVTPFLDGETLESQIRNRATPFDEKDALEIAAKIASVLRPIHESGIFHSDLKPSNIFFTTDGEIRLLDFGLAGKSGQSGISAGTACYASPEQLLGEQCDLRADLYSLGCILYELVTGSPPFISGDIAEILFNQVNRTPQPPIHIRPDISEFANALILNLLEKSPECRFQSTLELEQTLEVCETGSWWCERIAGNSDSFPPEKKIQGLQTPRSWQVPLVGRKAELERLCRKVSDSTVAGSGCFIVVGGAAGVGKTRLIEEALARCGSGAFILNSRCIKFDTRVPYLPLIDLIEDLRRRERFDSTRFQRFLTRHLPQTPLLVPRFMEFLSKQSQVSGDPGGLTTDNLLYLFTALFHHMASESPVALFIDDLHWADPSTCNFLRYFVRNIADVPLTVLGGYRPEELVSTGETEPPSTGLFRDLAIEPNFETISLAPLSARESFNLIESACGQAVGGELAPLMYQKTEGNPYYLFECINLLRGDGIILGRGAESRIASGVSEISIPSNVAELLKSRLARLNNEDRELLEYASIIGPVFTSEFLTSGDEAARLTLLRRLNKIEREHCIIRSRESGYAFDHHLLYEYIYQSIAPDLRAAFHREIASRIEKTPGGEPGEDIVYMLADHYSRGLDHARASEYLLRAARLSMAKYSGTEARDALNRARKHFMKIPPEGRKRDREWDFVLLACEIASHLGNNEQEEKAVREMEKLAEFFGTKDKALDVAEHRANYELGVSKFDSALADFETAKRIARETGDFRRVAKIANRIGMTYREMMRWEDAMRNLEEALETARSLKDSHLVGCILKDIGTVNTKQTRWREASVNLSEALPLLREAGDRREEAFALNGLAVSLFCGGDQDAALQRWEEANRIFESIGYPSGQSNILHNLGVTYANLGQIDRAIDCLRSALKLRQSIGMRHAQVSTLTRLGFVCFMIGAFDHAAEYLRSALTIARELSADLVCIEIYYHFTELSIALGDIETAAEHIKQAWKTLGTAKDPYHRAHLDLAAAMLALEKADFKAAKQFLDKAWAEDFNDPQLSSEIAVHSAWAEQGESQIESADRYIEQYTELSKGCPFIYARITGSVILHTVYKMRKDNAKLKAASDTLIIELEKIESGTTDTSLREAFQSRWGKYLL